MNIAPKTREALEDGSPNVGNSYATGKPMRRRTFGGRYAPHPTVSGTFVGILYDSLEHAARILEDSQIYKALLRSDL